MDVEKKSLYCMGYPEAISSIWQGFLPGCEKAPQKEKVVIGDDTLQDQDSPNLTRHIGEAYNLGILPPPRMLARHHQVFVTFLGSGNPNLYKPSFATIASWEGGNNPTYNWVYYQPITNLTNLSPTLPTFQI